MLDAELRLEASRRKEAELKLEEATAAAAENAAVSRDHSSRASAAIATTTAGAKENRNARIGTASGHVAPSLHVKGVGRVGASAGTGGRQSAATTPTGLDAAGCHPAGPSWQRVWCSRAVAALFPVRYYIAAEVRSEISRRLYRLSIRRRPRGAYVAAWTVM